MLSGLFLWDVSALFRSFWSKIFVETSIDSGAVQQYLAIGEAPDVTQQAFQQRSRWSKGHFQVFWSSECPLFDKRLNLFFRLAYSSTCVSYLSTGLSVIVLNIVPVLTILVGWFPITLNFYTVVGITAYFGALNALSYYCLSWSHYKVRLAAMYCRILAVNVYTKCINEGYK